MPFLEMEPNYAGLSTSPRPGPSPIPSRQSSQLSAQSSLHSQSSGPATISSSMAWVKERFSSMASAHLFAGSTSITPPVSPISRSSRFFARNDSSNSNTSASCYSTTEFGATPPRTPPPYMKTPTPTNKFFSSGTFGAQVNGSQGPASFSGPAPTSCQARIAAHLKLTPKHSGSSVTSSGPASPIPPPISIQPPSSGTNSSLRRQRFRQQTKRKLSKQTSSTGTSINGSRDDGHLGAGAGNLGTNIVANPIVDRLLDYVRDNHIRFLDPLEWEIQKKIRLTSFASFRLETGTISGIGNFERISDSKLTKSLDELTQIVLSSHIGFTDLLSDILFSTRIAKITLRNKHMRIFVEKCIVYVEISVDHTMSAKLRSLRVVSIDGLEVKTRGIPFPLNRSLDSFVSKTIHSMAANSDQYIERSLVPIINRFCDQYFESALKSISISDLFW